MQLEEKRAKLIKGAVSFTEETAIVASSYEQQLLDKYIIGELSIDEVVALLEDCQVVGAC
jgi:hypothetical protein